MSETVATPDKPVDARAAALAKLTATTDVAYPDAPLTDVERAAAVVAGINLTPESDPAEVRKATAEAGTGTPKESVTPRGDTRSEADYDPEKEPTLDDRDSALARLTAVATPAVTVPLTGTVIDMGGKLQRVVTASVYGASVAAQGSEPAQAMHARRGDIVLVTDKEAARGDKLRGLAELPKGASADKPEGTVELTPAGGFGDDGPKTDEQLGELNARELIAHVNKHPDDADRVLELEKARPQPRATVLALGDTKKN